jgi:hypothetical protein
MSDLVALRADVIRELKRVSRANPQVILEKPLAIVAVADYPGEGLTTLTTIGLSLVPHTMWRGKSCGFELTLTVPNAAANDGARDIANAAEESIRLHRSKERRPPVGYNGVWAPGFPPHYFFCEQLTQTPALAGRQRLGDGYVDWLPAIPISDAELRLHDRDVRVLMSTLATEPDLADWKARSKA